MVSGRDSEVGWEGEDEEPVWDNVLSGEVLLLGCISGEGSLV